MTLDLNLISYLTEKKTQLVVLSQAAKIQSHCTTSKNIIKHAKKVTEPTNFKATAGTTQNEMNAKVRRIVQWLCEYVSEFILFNLFVRTLKWILLSVKILNRNTVQAVL